ncbi:MAG: hypothetical protein IID13_10985 [Candidatus Marinimicrobia bacterium]|nr:hypothetical protein [Candidatus Neomarinimicrobiota bacterium]
MKIPHTKAIVTAIILAWLPSVAFAGITSTRPVSPTFARQWRWLDRDWSGALVPGPFVSYASLFLTRYDNRDIAIWQENEFRLYRDLLVRSIRRPRYLLLEATAYPLADISAWLQTAAPLTYRRFNLGKEFNLVRSLGAGFQEPWSVSLFLGQIDDFWELTDDDQLVVASSGISGLVLTAGWQQFFDNAVVPAGWLKAEWKLKGRGSHGSLQRSWNLNVGYRWYGLRQLDNPLIFSFRRQRTNRDRLDWGLARNTISLVELHLPPARAADGFTRIQLEFSKVFPLWKVLAGLKIGYLSENRREYNAGAKAFGDRRVQQSEIFIQPVVFF